jgi:cytochrome c
MKWTTVIILTLLLAAGCGGGGGGDAADGDADHPLVQAAAKNLPEGDPQRGASVYETCAACHLLEPSPDEPAFAPHLQGIIGREVAADGNYAYTEAMAGMQGVWTEERLAAYLHAPEEYVPGTEMIQALPDWQDVADVIAYLRAQQP